MRRRLIGPIVGLAALLAAAPAAAQTGFTDRGARRERSLEAAAMRAVRPADLSARSKALSARPHVAGSPGQAAVRDSLAAWLRRAGLDPRIETYRAYLPWPTSVTVTLVAPDTLAFSLTEPPIPGDPETAFPQYPWVNGYSGTGRAEGEVVYARLGLQEDYARLDSLGVDPAGKVVVARYGGAFRGVKARLAEEHGAAALVLYSDPEDDGYVQGDVYPDGPFRPAHGVQRGSLLNGAGDPTTPDGPSVRGAARVRPPTGPDGLPTIPVVPVSYAVAGEILSRVRGGEIPDQSWQGGLPFRYHPGPGPARVRVEVADDRDGPEKGLRPLYDVVARVEGTDWPDEVVVVGGHVDAWGPGANDNVSGAVSVNAAARAIAALDRRPRRTIVFAGWDGEEWGLIGSTEWVEDHADALAAGGVAYVNQDAIAGTSFGAGAAPSLKPLLLDAARAVPAPEGGSLYDVWAAAAAPADRSAPPPPPTPGDLGGGSDFAGFYNHLGIPATSHGFGRPGGVYHSGYDTWEWVERFGDPGFVHQAASARLTAVLALRLANAEILPYDEAERARELSRRWRVLRDGPVAGAGIVASEEVGELDAAFVALERVGKRLAVARDAYLAGAPRPAVSRRANRALIAAERALTRESGLEARPWYRDLAFAADRRNGYATLALPSVAEAARSGDPVRIRAEVADLARRVRTAVDRVAEAATALGG